MFDRDLAGRDRGVRGAVDRPPRRRAGTREVEVNVTTADGEVQDDLHWGRVEPAVVHVVGEGVGRVREVGEVGANLGFGASAQLGRTLPYGCRPIALEQLGEPFLADPQHIQLGFDVAGLQCREAGVVQEQAADVLEDLALSGQSHNRDTQAFLENVGCTRAE